jgi:hypothetical protein
MFSPGVDFVIAGGAMAVVKGPHHGQVNTQLLRGLRLQPASDAESGLRLNLFLQTNNIFRLFKLLVNVIRLLIMEV